MDLHEHFNIIAQEYDKKRRLFIPCYDDFYLHSTNFITTNVKQPHTIIDLGAGTGLLTFFWYKHFTNTEYILVDLADEMLKVAKERFKNLTTFSYITENYINSLPSVNFDIAISALSIHHLEDSEKALLFHNIYEKLPNHGIFVNYDQFCAGNPQINEWYNKTWEEYLYHNGLTNSDLKLWRERKKLDRECSVKTEIGLLEKCSFTSVECIFSSQKFSVIVAIK